MNEKLKQIADDLTKAGYTHFDIVEREEPRLVPDPQGKAPEHKTETVFDFIAEPAAPVLKGGAFAAVSILRKAGADISEGNVHVFNNSLIIRNITLDAFSNGKARPKQPSGLESPRRPRAAGAEDSAPRPSTPKP